MSDSSSLSIESIVAEEQALLTKVRACLHDARFRAAQGADYDAELIELRDALAEALPEDVPSLVEQMTRLQALAAQRGQGADVPVTADNPYFGHLRIREGGKVKDVLLGKRTFLAPDHGVHIVDWRNAPISSLYYLYEEGDEYEEEIGGVLRCGTVLVRRSVTIVDGTLRRIDIPQGAVVLRASGWELVPRQRIRLAGGQGTAIRGTRYGALGVDHAGMLRTDKHLPEISALLDKDQFRLISADTGGILAITGSAGSGKTTVALHRVAYLVFSKAHRVRPARTLVVVRNRALQRYVEDVLPSLGVHGVQVTTFAQWASQQRKRHISGLPTTYAHDTPQAVSRIKRHPAMLPILFDAVDSQDERLTASFAAALEPYADAQRVLRAWRASARLPLDARRRRLVRWLDGEVRIGGDDAGDLDEKTAVAAGTLLDKIAAVSASVVDDWAELFTDADRLHGALEAHAPTEFSREEVETAVAWCSEQYKRILDAQDREDEDDAQDADPDDGPWLDPEDDALLLYLYQRKVGWLARGNRRLEYDHLAVDEVQDFSPLEVRVLLDTMPPKAPVTLAGDPAQQIYADSGFSDWETLFDAVGARDTKLATLQVAYRSTAEVMEVAQAVLGPLAGDPPAATRHGAPVELHQFGETGQAVDFLSGALRDLAGREPTASVGVLARHEDTARTYFAGLRRAQLGHLRLVLDENFSFRPGVDVTTIYQAKGLEFDYVVVVEVNADVFPATDEARRLLHVAMTRAAHQLWLLSCKTPSPLLPGHLL